MSHPGAHRSHVLGCPVDRLTAVELRGSLPAIAQADDLTHLVTLNPEHVMFARAEAEIHAIISSAEIVTADGVGITLALKLQGESPQDRITGVDIVEWIAAAGLPVFFLGGADGIARVATNRLRERFPTTNVVGNWSGGTPEPRHDEESIRRINESGARILCVAYGAPAQLRWIERNRSRLHDAGVRLAMGVGGSLDYHAGTVRRPPRLVQKMGLEWLARLIREPWRWRRQLVLPRFAGLALMEAIRSRLASR